jgi:hypothetical protein
MPRSVSAFLRRFAGTVEVVLSPGLDVLKRVGNVYEHALYVHAVVVKKLHLLAELVALRRCM